MMEKNKKVYESPATTETKVELESSICSGSVDITGQAPTGGADIEVQSVNTDFSAANDFSNDAWD